MNELKARNTGHESNNVAQDRQKTLAREKAQLDFEVEELADSMQARLQASAKQADASVSNISATMSRILEKDDRLLDGLQKLLPRLGDDAADGHVAEDVDRLCQALIALSAQEIRLRIDAAYKASGAVSPSKANGQVVETEKQNQSLRAELDELSSEIDGLATMAVDARYRAPLLRELHGSTSDAANDRARWSHYVAETLQYLTTRLVSLEEHCQHLHAHQGALSQVAAALEVTVAKPAASQTKRNTQQAVDRSPATPTARGLKPLRLVQANLSEPQDPIMQLLRSFDIRVTDTGDVSRLTATLEQASKDRRARLEQLHQSTERTISDQFAETLIKADKDVQDLLAAVFAHSRFCSVKLVDPEVDAGIGQLEAETQELGEQMRGLDIEAIARTLKERQREILGR